MIVKTHFIDRNQKFIGREFEQNYIRSIEEAETPAILVVYGRHRVGKTELIEQTLQDRGLLKFEGIEGQGETLQMEHVLTPVY